MTEREKVNNNIMIKMRYHMDAGTMDILAAVLTQELSAVEITGNTTLPATRDDANSYIMELFRVQKAPKLSERTVRQYMDAVRRLIDTVQKPLTDVTSMDIDRYLAGLRSCNQEVSINNQRRHISAVYTWMRRSHIVQENPCESVDPYKVPLKPIDHMEPEETEQLKAGCRHKRDRALIEVLRSTAMRVGELENVKVRDVDWRQGQLLIYGEKTRAYRPVCLDSVALKYLGEYITERGVSPSSPEPLFTTLKSGQHEGLTRAGIRAAVKGIKQRANMDRRVYPHLFRKTTATNIVKRGGSVHDAGEYLGHKDRSTAGQYYAYVSQDHTVDIFNRYVATV